VPRVSVIMAAYNGEKVIRKSIDSILSQTLHDLELIIVDDGSTDNTVGVVGDILDKRIVLLKQVNSGSPAAPRNFGISKARGDMIAFCDQDDIWYPEKLAKQITAYGLSDDKENVGIIFSSADLVNDAGEKVDKNMTKFRGYLPSDKALTRLLEGDFIIACSAVVPKKALDRVGKLNERLVGVDDYELWIRISKYYGILAVPEILCAWRQTTGSLSTDKTKQYIRTEKIFESLGDKTTEEKIGHGKNILRVILSALIDGNYALFREYLTKIKGYPLSPKSKAIVLITQISPSFGRLFVLGLQRIGVVSL